jgi:predicted acylesterase/phospholipase RssA
MEFNSNLNFLKKSDIKIGLALGGGTALGFAHIGVLKAFEDGECQLILFPEPAPGLL